MKIYLFLGFGIAILGTTAVSVIAQGQRNDTNSSSSGIVQTSKIIGTSVKTAQGEQIGAVKDVILDRNTGCIAYTVLSSDGTGGTAKMVALPWAVYSSTEPGHLVVSVERDRIYSAPAFDDSRIDEYSTAEYIDNLNSYFGVSAGVMSSTATTSASTNSAARGKASASASPTQNTSGKAGVSPRPTRNPSTKATPRETAAEGAATTESPTENASPTGKRGRAYKETPAEEPKATPGSQGRRTETGRERTGESPPETSERSSSEGKQGNRERSTTRETTEPSATPLEQR